MQATGTINSSINTGIPSILGSISSSSMGTVVTLLRSPTGLTPFRTAVFLISFWDKLHTIFNLNYLSPKRDCCTTRIDWSMLHPSYDRGSSI